MNPRQSSVLNPCFPLYSLSLTNAHDLLSGHVALTSIYPSESDRSLKLNMFSLKSVFLPIKLPFLFFAVQPPSCLHSSLTYASILPPLGIHGAFLLFVLNPPYWGIITNNRLHPFKVYFYNSYISQCTELFIVMKCSSLCVVIALFPSLLYLIWI